MDIWWAQNLLHMNNPARHPNQGRGQAFSTKVTKGTSNAWAYDSERAKEIFGCSNHLESVTFNLGIKYGPIKEEVQGNMLLRRFWNLNRTSDKDNYLVSYTKQILQIILKSKMFSLLDGYLGYN